MKYELTIAEKLYIEDNSRQDKYVNTVELAQRTQIPLEVVVLHRAKILGQKLYKSLDRDYSQIGSYIDEMRSIRGELRDYVEKASEIDLDIKKKTRSIRSCFGLGAEANSIRDCKTCGKHEDCNYIRQNFVTKVSLDVASQTVIDALETDASYQQTGDNMVLVDRSEVRNSLREMLDVVRGKSTDQLGGQIKRWRTFNWVSDKNTAAAFLIPNCLGRYGENRTNCDGCNPEYVKVCKAVVAKELLREWSDRFPRGKQE